MKYFKFAQISEETGISWAIAQPSSGPSYPKIPGLNLNLVVQLSQSPIYYVANVADNAVLVYDNVDFTVSLTNDVQEFDVGVQEYFNYEIDLIEVL